MNGHADAGYVIEPLPIPALPVVGTDKLFPVHRVYCVGRNYAEEKGGIFQLTTHPRVIGYRSCIWILEELIRHANSKPGVWFGTHAEVAAWAKVHAA